MSSAATDPRAPGELASRWAIGLLRLPSGCQPYTVSLRDIERDTAWAKSVFERVGLRSGAPLHLIGTGCDNEILWPYENALIAMKVPFGVAEPVAIDAPRSDMFLRRFRMQAVMGLSGEPGRCAVRTGARLERPARPLDAGRAAGRGACAAGRGALAVGDASDRADLGLRVAGRDGARYDESEWLIEEDAGGAAVDGGGGAGLSAGAAAHRRARAGGDAGCAAAGSCELACPVRMH
jgi:hypothetical protein